MKIRLLAGLRYLSGGSENEQRTLNISSDEQGDLYLAIEESGGVFGKQKSSAIRVYSAMGDSRMNEVHAKLLELTELINNLHKEHPTHPAFVPENTDK
jgi:hypothetical protein